MPEDRAVAGIFRTLSVEQNITAAVPGRSRRAASSAARWKRRWRSDSVRKLRIRLASLRQPIGELSGGNQQKAILARWLLTDPSVLILDEPTRGIDIGVKAEFYDMIGELAASGRAILLISSELPELLALCDRVLVMSEGRLTADLAARRGDAGSDHARRRAAQPSRGGRRMSAAPIGIAVPRREAGILVMIVLFARRRRASSSRASSRSRRCASSCSLIAADHDRARWGR